MDDIRGIILRGEGTTTEFRKNADKVESAMKTACAFLNTSGGYVLFGVSRQQKIIGLALADYVTKEIEGLMERFEPKADYSISKIPVSGRPGASIIALRMMPPHDGEIHCYDGKAYYRDGTETRRMPFDMMVDRIRGGLPGNRWEQRQDPGIKASDIDRGRLSAVLGKEAPSSDRDTLEVLKDLGLATQNKVIFNSATVLFSRRCSVLPLQCRMRLARFEGRDRLVFRDETTVCGNIFDLYEESLSFISRYMVPSMVPAEVLREIVVNMLAHREYSRENIFPSIAIFDDRIEFRSPGGFPVDSSPEFFIANPHSNPRNPLIVEVLKKAGLMKGWGTGLPFVVSAMSKEHLPAPEFINHSDCFAVILKFHSTLEKGLDDSKDEASSAVTKEDVKVETKAKAPEKEEARAFENEVKAVKPSAKPATESKRLSTPPVPAKAPSRPAAPRVAKAQVAKPSPKAKKVESPQDAKLDKVVSMIRKDPGINASTISEKLKVSFRTATRYLASLMEKGAVERRGSKKTGGYYIPEKA